MSDRIAILLSGKKMGGDTKVVLNLIDEFVQRGIEVDLVLASLTELSRNQLPEAVRVIDLKTPLTARAFSTIQLLPALIQYLYQAKPKVLISNLSFTNAIVVLTKFLVFPAPKLILVEHLALSKNQDRPDEPQSRLLPALMQSLYPKADAIVAVAQKMAAQLQEDYDLKTVHAISNAVVNNQLVQKAAEPLDHPWFDDSIPVFLGVGRFAAQKDFTTLIQAFSILRQQAPARLIILGEGALRSRLEAQIEALNLQNDVLLPGFDPNPYRYMSRATAFVLSSRWEALPTVLIEAMACGCQVIGTRCPFGVEEILANGEFGQLVPIEDAIALSQAMKTAIDSPISPEALKFRAQSFSAERAVDRYLDLINQLR
ncbi:glycosyltransferase [Leptolyngbya sp. NIES-2104]|uniref:glycosyltransferase n=1 Tax=Leptolyngbya sp. NIES-2104 TaxID=1552121 RepID=UPI0006EC5830|nr:glycosyltransferase [Leptolyngbya sp. NIES-2104]GAP93632.1 glycosyl transferase, group 1 [Leptolyngbya sp. NIES-2104]